MRTVGVRQRRGDGSWKRVADEFHLRARQTERESTCWVLTPSQPCRPTRRGGEGQGRRQRGGRGGEVDSQSKPDKFKSG